MKIFWINIIALQQFRGGNGDTLVEEYELIKEDMEFYQIGENEYEITIYIDIEINRSQDTAIGEFYEKNDKYHITQGKPIFLNGLKEIGKMNLNLQLVKSVMKYGMGVLC